MPSKIAELYADFRVNVERATLDVLNTTLGELRLSTIAEVTSLAGLTKVLFNVGRGALDTATNFHALAEVYGINTQQLQRMEIAGLAANVSVDKIQQSVVGLQQNLAGLQLGQINQGFLQAAGFLGVRIGPQSDEQDVMKQLFKTVPQFVKNHGKLGRAMASTLLGQLGVAPEALQYILAGKEYKAGPTLQDKEIQHLTDVSEKLAVLARDIEYLSYNAIEPLIDAVNTLATPITSAVNWLTQNAGLAGNLAHPIKTAEAAASYVGGLVQSGRYQTDAAARAMAERLKYQHEHPLLSAFQRPSQQDFAAGVEQARRMFVQPHQETHIVVNGVEDQKIAHAVRRAAEKAHETQRRDYAMNAAINNAPGH